MDRVKNSMDQEKHKLMIMPEFAAFMIEVVPLKPFSYYLNPHEIYEHFNNIIQAFKSEKVIQTL